MRAGASGSTQAHLFGWRDAMDIAVKWRQLAEPNDQARTLCRCFDGSSQRSQYCWAWPPGHMGTAAPFMLMRPRGSHAEQHACSCHRLYDWHLSMVPLLHGEAMLHASELAVRGRQVLWVDLLTRREFEAGFGSHTPIFSGQTRCVRYYMNFKRGLELFKEVLLEVGHPAGTLGSLLRLRSLKALQSYDVLPGVLSSTHRGAAPPHSPRSRAATHEDTAALQ